MEFIPINRILDFNADQLKSVRKQYNLDNSDDMSRAIDVLETWIKTQKHFIKKDLPRNYLEKAIIAGKGSIERAKRRLDKMCTFRTVMPNFFEDYLTKSSFEDIHVFRSVLLPKPTSENYRIYVLKAIGSTFTYDLLLDCYKIITMLLEYVMAYDYADGIIVLIDYSEVDLYELIKYLSLTELHQIFKIITEGFGLRLKRIDILTSSKAVHAFVALLKPLISPKLGKRICIHKDLSTLHQYVPKELLPVEYGGEEKSFKEIHDKVIEELAGKEFRKYLKEMNEAKTDESLRQTDAFNELYLDMPGSFRTLNVD